MQHPSMLVLDEDLFNSGVELVYPVDLPPKREHSIALAETEDVVFYLNQVDILVFCLSIGQQ